MTNVDTECVVAGLGTIVYCNGSAFDKASKVVLKKSDELISFRDLAYARIVDAENRGSWKNSSLCTNGSYVKEGSLFVPNSNNKRIWLSDSLVLQKPALAVKAHKNNVEYVPRNFKVGEYLEQIGKDNYFVLSDTSSIPTNRFGEDARTVWAFKDQAKDYGLLLDGAGIKAMNIWMYNDNASHIDSQSGPFANQLWLHRLDFSSDIDGDDRDLGDDFRVRGVRRESSAEGAQKNIVQVPSAPSETTYNSKQIYSFIDTTLKNVGISGDVKKLIISDLEKKLK